MKVVSTSSSHSLNCLPQAPRYAEPIHLPLVRHVFPHSGSAVDRSLLGVERRNTFDVILSPETSDDSNYIPISVGTPTQILHLPLSFNFPGALFGGCKGCSGDSTVFDTASSSARNKSTTGTQFIPALGIQGSFFTDVVGFGPFSVLDASFVVVDATFVFLGQPGAFGLGFPNASFQNLPSVAQSLLSTNPVDAPEMGIWLSRVHNTSTSKAGTPGVFTFGGTNSSLYTGDIEFLDLTSTSAWMLNITTLTIQGHELTLTQSRNSVVFEVVKSVIYGPTSSVAAIWAQVPGASLLNISVSGGTQYYQYPCSTTLNISVAFGGRSWTLDPAELNGGPITGDNKGHCHGAILGFDEAEDQPGWIFGEPFLRSVYTVLRQSNPAAIGFAELSEQAGGAPSPTLPSTSSSGSVSSPPRTAPPPASAKHSPVAAVVGGVIGALILCAALLAALLLARRRQRQGRPDEGGIKRDLTPEPFLAVDQRREMAPLNSAERRFKRKVQANGASPNYPYQIDAGSRSATQPGETAGGGENGGSSSPTPGAEVSIMEELRNLREDVRRLAERDAGGSIAPPSYHPDA
ncbi:aspartic peptidase domain-containing protein [Favolaschia claudopus]|uniref:Aspartic peptidase domain-containing protein n=1 Tax=Favolaschia claudopus TaxID=2862362 RepID=A0AAW0EGE1_9AGAR